MILLLHLLKWEFQSERRSGSWKGSIREHRQLGCPYALEDVLAGDFCRGRDELNAYQIWTSAANKKLIVGIIVLILGAIG